MRIWRTVSAIPLGRVATYGQVADLSGLPRGARQVGWALKQLPSGTDVPWHRVIAAPGRIAFEPGSRSYRAQCDRLRAEGIAVVQGRIDLRQHGWTEALDALLWGPLAEPSRGTDEH